jgi:hypothetical protein
MQLVFFTFLSSYHFLITVTDIIYCCSSFLQRGSEQHNLMHFWYDTWPDHKTPPSAHSLVAMAREVEAIRTSKRR